MSVHTSASLITTVDILNALTVVSAVKGCSRRPRSFAITLTRVVNLGLEPKTIEAEARKNTEFVKAKIEAEAATPIISYQVHCISVSL